MPDPAGESGHRYQHTDSECEHDERADDRTDRNDAIECSRRESALATRPLQQPPEYRPQQRDTNPERNQHRRQSETERNDRDHSKRSLSDPG